MIKSISKKLSIISIFLFFVLSSCAKEGFFKPGDARKNPPDPKLRVKKNLEEGRGFRLDSAFGKSAKGAPHITNVGEVDISVNDVRNRVAYTFLTYFIGAVKNCLRLITLSAKEYLSISRRDIIAS